VYYNEDALIEADILGAPIAEGGMINVTGLQRLHNGAIWQNYVANQETRQEVDKLRRALLASGVCASLLEA
jgi:hypothetical protein